MKFVLFNVAVAAALVFLFTADRGEVQKIAGRVHDAAGDMKAYANKALKTGETLLGREAAKADRKTQPAPVAQPTQTVTQPARQAVTQPAVQPAPQPPAPPAVTRSESPTKPQSAPPLSRRLARNLPAMPETGEAVVLDDLDPAVAKRRREVLNGIDSASNSADAAPVLKEGSRLMTPSERRKELLSLAEEMELLYARSISR